MRGDVVVDDERGTLLSTNDAFQLLKQVPEQRQFITLGASPKIVLHKIGETNEAVTGWWYAG
ncbi:MAG: hypothetical protein ACREBR_02475, partial [bacterium]